MRGAGEPTAVGSREVPLAVGATSDKAVQEQLEEIQIKKVADLRALTKMVALSVH